MVARLAAAVAERQIAIFRRFQRARPLHDRRRVALVGTLSHAPMACRPTAMEQQRSQRRRQRRKSWTRRRTTKNAQQQQQQKTRKRSDVLG